MQKKKNIHCRFKSEAKKINTNVEFYRYSRLIKKNKQRLLRVFINLNAKINLINQYLMI